MDLRTVLSGRRRALRYLSDRSNRIRNLIQLERYAEASAALLPFANGEFGSYR